MQLIVYAWGMVVQYTQRRGERLGRFPNEIRRYRIQAGLTQRRLGAVIGRRRNIISSWERGHSLPSLRNALRLAKALGTMTESLYRDLYSLPQENRSPDNLATK